MLLGRVKDLKLSSLKGGGRIAKTKRDEGKPITIAVPYWVSVHSLTSTVQ